MYIIEFIEIIFLFIFYTYIITALTS